jgi:hypothetical protein
MIILPTLHDDLHVVVQADGRRALQMLERAHMLANRGLKVLRLGEVNVLSPGIAQDVAEQIHTTPTFVGEFDVVHGVIHLCLHAGRSLETNHRLLLGLRT